jgi:hypothetical protein
MGVSVVMTCRFVLNIAGKKDKDWSEEKKT